MRYIQIERKIRKCLYSKMCNAMCVCWNINRPINKMLHKGDHIEKNAKHTQWLQVRKQFEK